MYHSTLPVPKTSKRYKRKKVCVVVCVCVLANERLDPSFNFGEEEFPHACDPGNANDSTSAYS